MQEARHGRSYDGMADFEQRILPQLQAMPCFRAPGADELTRSYRAYLTGDPVELLKVWQEVSSPLRARLVGVAGLLYARDRLVPGRLGGLAFLQVMRAVLRAGERFRERLAPATRAALLDDFPWLAERHQHIPPGPAPALEFPPFFSEFLEAGDVDDARARWQLLVALNEVEQSSYSSHLGRRLGLEELERHAARERELAVNYLGHWSPPASERLWRQVIQVLDGLNAAVFEVACARAGFDLMARALASAVRGVEWPAFRAGLDRPQRMLSVLPANRTDR